LVTYIEGLKSLGLCIVSGADIFKQRTFPSFTVESSQPITLSGLQHSDLPILYGFQELLASGTLLGVVFDNGSNAVPEVEEGGVADLSLSMIGIVAEESIVCDDVECSR